MQKLEAIVQSFKLEDVKDVTEAIRNDNRGDVAL